VGAHGLPLMGSGDWNDGMNRVGIEGRGESVWLGWFLCTVVAAFAPLARERGELARAQTWETAAQGWTQALMGAAWDGQWFKRAFFDNGEPLGSSANAEGRIDLIAQAWAVLSGVAPRDKQQTALASIDAYLMDEQAGLIKLLDPPLVNAVPSAGYIQAYPPGVRENGGQYSHGAIWALMAQAELARHDPASTQADIDKVWRSFTWLNPAHRASHPVQGPAYGLEPYVMAGDIYTQPPYVGRGGWSWYTGAAAWMHRAAIESIFGLQLGATDLSFNPCLPSHWPQAELTLRREQRSLRFILVRGDAAKALAATAQWNTQLLPVGQTLRWVDVPEKSCFVVALALADSDSE
jgi:cyclic beta-1,2-glucan synthetase